MTARIILGRAGSWREGTSSSPAQADEQVERVVTGIIGQQAANMLLLTGRRIGGEEAFKLGLVDVLTDADSLREEAMKLAQEIAENAPLAVLSVRATMRDGLAEAVIEATEHELKEQQWLRATEDAQEGIRSVAERRPGNFQGR